MLETITIEKITQNDVEEVFNIESLIHPEHHWSKDSFYNEIANNLARYFCVKNQDNKILAFMGFWVILEEAHITTLGTHPDFRNKQLAQALLVQCIETCYKEEVKYITLEVRESNVPAIRLYEKFGFSSIGMRKNYYQDNGENAIIMFTQNIWYDSFKNNFAELKENIKKVSVSYAK